MAQGFQLTKLHGQHLLTNMGVINNIIKAGEIRPSDTILEIGPGSGNLTMHLLQHAKHVIVIEIDPRMVSELKKRVPMEYRAKLTIIHGDFTKVDIPEFDLCISNCPYNISSLIVFKLLALAHERQRVRKFVLMFQLEFAQGLAAQPGQQTYCRLSVNSHLLAKTIKILFKVDPKNFTPPPLVDSAVIEIVPLAQTKLSMEEYLQFEGLTKVCFSTKNKTLGAIFKNKAILIALCENYELIKKEKITQDDMKTKILEILYNLDIHESRPVSLGVSDFLKLLSKFGKKGIYFTN